MTILLQCLFSNLGFKEFIDLLWEFLYWQQTLLWLCMTRNKTKLLRIQLQLNSKILFLYKEIANITINVTISNSQTLLLFDSIFVLFTLFTSWKQITWLSVKEKTHNPNYILVILKISQVQKFNYLGNVVTFERKSESKSK